MKYVTLLLTLLLPLLGCKDNVETKIVAASYLMDASALDLGMITTYLKDSGGAADGDALAQWINATPGVNNVDLDKDGKTDLITIEETRGEDGKSVMALTAVPAKGEPVVAAELNFERKGEEVVITADYPDYVQGHETRYVTPLGHTLFAAWLFAPRPVFYHPVGYYRSYGWANPRPVLSRQALTTTRTTTQKTLKVSPVKKTKQPATYKSKSAGAQKVAAKRTKALPSSSIKSSAGKGDNFTKRDTTKAKAKATNATRAKPKTTQASAASKPSLPQRPRARSKPKSSSRRASTRKK